MKMDKIELFDKLFSCYFSTVYHVLRESANKELTDAELRKLVSKTSDYYGFPETTSLIIRNAFNPRKKRESDDAGKSIQSDADKDAWPFFERIEKPRSYANGTAKAAVANINRLNSISTIPLSRFEKMWLKSILSDPRIKLFTDEATEFPDLKDVEPLFDWDDYVLFDRYTDGDPFQDAHYIEMFRKVLKAVRNHSRLEIKFRKANKEHSFTQNEFCKPASERKAGTICIDADHLEYSERDDKFRLVGNNPRFGRNMVNIASILSCDEVDKADMAISTKTKRNSEDDIQKKAIFELKDDRNALERFLMHFSHYEKEAEYLKEKKRYLISIIYDESDEKDVVIRVLSFGQHVKAVGPEHFKGLITDRLQKQIDLQNELRKKR